MCTRYRVALTLPLVGLLSLAAGCNQAGFGRELAHQPPPKPLQLSSTQTLELPANEPFNITLNRTTEEPTLAGTVDTHASANGQDGTARVHSEVRDGGFGRAEAQIGYAFVNQTGHQLNVKISVEFEYTVDLQLDPPTTLPNASAAMRLLVRHPRGRVLRDIPLVEQSTDDGPFYRKSRDEAALTVPLAPGGALNVYVAGLASIDAPAGRHASATLQLSDFVMRIESIATTETAPPADDTQ
jgi:hypothetical protein